MIYERQLGVPKFECMEYASKTKDYVVLIPIINEGERIHQELARAKEYKISSYADIVICDGGSTDGSTDEKKLKSLEVNTLLIKKDIGKQASQLRMGIWWALKRNYKGLNKYLAYGYLIGLVALKDIFRFGIKCQWGLLKATIKGIHNFINTHFS